MSEKLHFHRIWKVFQFLWSGDPADVVIFLLILDIKIETESILTQIKLCFHCDVAFRVYKTCVEGLFHLLCGY